MLRLVTLVSGYIISVSLMCSFTTLCAGAAVGPTASKSNSYRKTCVGIKYDLREAASCENRLHPGAGLSCCAGRAFNPEEATCCKVEDGNSMAAVTEGLSEKVSHCCGLKAYNRLNEICCQSAVRVKPAPVAGCCGKEAFDVDTQMCCGPISNKRILTRGSREHLCCAHHQFDPWTDCCCSMSGGLKIQPISSSCCAAEAGPTPCGLNTYSKAKELCCQSTVVAKPASSARCCGKQAFKKDTQLCCGPMDNKRILTRESREHLCCGHHQFDPRTECCCSMSGGLKIQPISSSCCEEEAGRPADAPVVYKPHTHVCCGVCSSEWKPWTDQFHGLPGQHCCGAKVRLPHAEISRDGQRRGNAHCCGVTAYDIRDPQVKCCAGTLHAVPGGREAQCCGSSLQTAPEQSVCCSSEAMAVLYSANVGFGCCGHLYYNSSLWSCCAGRLSPGPQPGRHRREKVKESTLLSLNNLKEEDLCDEMHIGTMESVSPFGIVFASVLRIRGNSSVVTPLASPHTLHTPDHCSAPRLAPGRSYFFDDVNVFTDSNHDSVLQSLHFIISMCHRPVTNS